MTYHYVCSSGSYSDYGIDAVFDNFEAALAFSSKDNSWRENEIEVWEGEKLVNIFTIDNDGTYKKRV